MKEVTCFLFLLTIVLLGLAIAFIATGAGSIFAGGAILMLFLACYLEEK